MSKGQMLRALVKQRLSLAAEEIFDLFERTIAEYEEQLCRSKEENERQRKLLDAVFKPQLRLHRAGVQTLRVFITQRLTAAAEEIFGPFDRMIAEYEEQLCRSDEANERQRADVQPLSNKEVPPEQEDWRSSLDQDDPPQLPHIKEEPEDLWTNQEEADIIKFTFTPVPVKSEDDDEEEPQSSQLHQRQTEQMETDADGEDCGGPEPARSSDPDGHFQPETEDKSVDSSETEVSDGDWEETREPQSDVNSQINNETPVGDVVCSPGQEPLICSECGLLFVGIEHLVAHMRMHTGEKPFSCSVCDKRFKQKVHLTVHMYRHTGEKPFHCSVCNRRFTWPYQLKRHKCVLHQSTSISANQTKSETVGGDHGGPEQARNSNPERHLQPEPEDKAEDSSEIEDKAEDSSEPETEGSDGDLGETREPQPGLNSSKTNELLVSDTDKKPVMSSDRGETSSQNSQLKGQMDIDKEEEPFRCSVCGKKNLRKSHLIRHMRSHTGEKPYRCSECGKTFSLKGNLTKHMVSHTGEKPFSCSKCGHGFTQKAQLTQHMALHTGEKPFSCSECGKSFIRKVQLTQHMVHHSGEKPFSCSECGKRFVQNRNLIQHMASHTGEQPYVCPVCGKGFTNNTLLTRHMACHTGEKPFTCPVCGKGFSQKANLTSHMAVHTGEKRHHCSVCDNRFTWKSQLQFHQCVGDPSSSLQTENGQKEPPTNSSAEQMKTEAGADDCEGPEPSRTSDPDQQHSIIID